MSNPKWIEPGDKVYVEWEYLEPLLGIVESVPQATGDCWSVRRHDGKLVYVQQYSRMVLQEKADEGRKG